MKAYVAKSARNLQLIEKEIPSPGENQVLVRTKTAGICGSDIHLYRGDHPYTTYPMIFGHEASGIIEKNCAVKTELQKGDRVVLEPTIFCGSCYPCSIGRTNCCRNMKTIGVTVDGALSEYFVAPVENIHKIPDNLSIKLAALVEPLSIGFHAVYRADVKENEKVLVIGAGPIGLSILAAAKSRHAEVMITDISDFRLNIAEKMGADFLFNNSDDTINEFVGDWTQGQGVPVVFEAVGTPVTIESAVSHASDAGRVVVVGVTGKKFSVRGVDITKKELTIYGSRNNLGQFQTALGFLSESYSIAEKMISQVFAFEETPLAFKFADCNSSKSCKVLIDF